MAGLSELAARLQARAVRVADLGAVRFTSSAGKEVAIPVTDPAATVYVTAAGRQVTAGEVEQWAGAQTGRPVRAVLRRGSRRAVGRQAEQEEVAARPAQLVKGMVRGHGQAPTVPPPKAPAPNPPARGRLGPPSPGSGGIPTDTRRELEDLRDDLDHERQVSAMLRRQLDASRRSRLTYPPRPIP